MVVVLVLRHICMCIYIYSIQLNTNVYVSDWASHVFWINLCLVLFHVRVFAASKH